MSKSYSTHEGFKNANRQTVVRQADSPEHDQDKVVYVMRCGDCAKQYGANAADIFDRKCPKCQGGEPGLEF